MNPELPFFREDIALKNAVRTPANAKPRFNWRESLPAAAAGAAGAVGADSARFADIIGNALTDLLLSRQVTDIFTEQNRAFVAAVAGEVTQLVAQLAAQNGGQVSEAQLIPIIERALINNNRHDVAKSLVFSSDAVRGVDVPVVTTRLMRRNHQVVPWNQDKIDIAVRKSFLSLGLDSAPAERVAAAVTRTVAQGGQNIIGIEEVQDIVQVELMRQGHYKVAEAYILYRAMRTKQREQEAAAAVPVDDHQDSLLLVKNADGSTFLWNGEDLRKRISYALTGLDIDMPVEAIEAELRRGLFNEVSEADLRKTVELNAKTLIERDADFSLFAARIALSYIADKEIPIPCRESAQPNQRKRE